MEEGLFKKHLIQVYKKKTQKEEVIKYIQEISGILLQESDFTVTHKKIKINVSSVLQSKLNTKKVIDFLQTKGFIFNPK